MMTKDGDTYSKYCYKAMEVGEGISHDIREAVNRIFNTMSGRTLFSPPETEPPKSSPSSRTSPIHTNSSQSTPMEARGSPAPRPKTGRARLHPPPSYETSCATLPSSSHAHTHAASHGWS
jgi:hypothetical protein